VKLVELLELIARHLRAEAAASAARHSDDPISAGHGRRLVSIGMLRQYAFDLDRTPALEEDVPVTILPGHNIEPTEGFSLGFEGQTIWFQTFDDIGRTIETATVVPDTIGFLQTVAQRLTDLAKQSASSSMGPAERLAPWLAPGAARSVRPAPAGSVLSVIWHPDRSTRRRTLAASVVDLVRQNKRLLIVSPSHRKADELANVIAQALRSAGLSFKSLLCRYEMCVHAVSPERALQELGFEAQMHQFYSQARADKAALRRKYERFRELTPLLAQKAESQRDLDEVKLLEWRLLTQLHDLQEKIKEIEKTLAEYAAIPVWKRLAMQTMGRNLATLADYRSLYQEQIRALQPELETAQGRIAELAPQAAIPKDIRPEYEELKEEIGRLGGMKQIRELLAAEEGTNRQAFLQNKRIVVTTAARVSIDPLFTRVPFDILMADDAPLIPACHLLTAAAQIRERIMLSGNEEDRRTSRAWDLHAMTETGQPLEMTPP
jgi:hypothetical protein